MRHRTILVSLVTAGALSMTGLTAATAAPAAPGPWSSASAQVVADEPSGDRADGMTRLLDQLTAVPDDVLLAGDDATAAWFAENVPASTDASIPGCIGAISLAIAGVAFPAAKILRIKKLINELGGVADAVRLLWGASFSYEKVQAAGGALAALGAELIGITQVKEQCFE